MYFTGTTVLKVIDGKIVEECGVDDGVTALTQPDLIKTTARNGDALCVLIQASHFALI